MVRCLTQTNMMTELAQKLPTLRESYDISQTQLGTLIGKSRQQISKIEGGITPLGWDTCLAIVMVTRNRDAAVFNKVIGNNYFTQIHNFINSYEKESCHRFEEEKG